MLACAHCRRDTLTAADFGPNKARKSGRDNYCRDCRRDYNSRYEATHRATRTSYKRTRRRLWREARQMQRAWQERRRQGGELSAAEKRAHDAAIHRSWRARNRRRYNETMRAWKRKHPERRALYGQAPAPAGGTATILMIPATLARPAFWLLYDDAQTEPLLWGASEEEARTEAARRGLEVRQLLRR